MQSDSYSQTPKRKHLYYVPPENFSRVSNNTRKNIPISLVCGQHGYFQSPGRMSTGTMRVSKEEKDQLAAGNMQTIRQRYNLRHRFQSRYCNQELPEDQRGLKKLKRTHFGQGSKFLPHRPSTDRKMFEERSNNHD